MAQYKKKDGTISTYNYNKGNPIDILCNRINETLHLNNREVGSLERYTDMCTNKIVQIANPYGGYIDIAYGTEKQLIAYLKNILINI